MDTFPSSAVLQVLASYIIMFCLYARTRTPSRCWGRRVIVAWSCERMRYQVGKHKKRNRWKLSSSSNRHHYVTWQTSEQLTRSRTCTSHHIEMDESVPLDTAGPSRTLSSVVADEKLPIKRRKEHKRKSGGTGKKGKIFLEDKVGFQVLTGHLIHHRLDY